MTTLVTAPYRTVALDRRMLAIHAKPSAYGPPSTQGGFGTPLTRYLTDVLTHLVGGWPKSRIDELMPWHWATEQAH